MNSRPVLGARVRVRAHTGIPHVAGRCGTVARLHEDGTAFLVRFTDGRAPGFIVCDPSDVEDLSVIPEAPV